MATFALVPGADGAGWYWHLVAPRLREAGHTAVTFDLPSDDSSDLDAFADATADAIRAAAGPAPLVVVAQSLAGFCAPLVCERLAVDRLVLVNAMVPVPGETAGQWWDATGQPAARAAHAAGLGLTGADAGFDVRRDFFHDVPEELTRQALAAEPGGPPSGVFAQPFPAAAWPDVPTRFLQGVDDRFFPLEFQRAVVRERLGLAIEELPGGHLLALSRPEALTAALLDEAAAAGR